MVNKRAALVSMSQVNSCRSSDCPYEPTTVGLCAQGILVTNKNLNLQILKY
jgi:hypothetical protein